MEWVAAPWTVGWSSVTAATSSAALGLLSWDHDSIAFQRRYQFFY